MFISSTSLPTGKGSTSRTNKWLTHKMSSCISTPFILPVLWVSMEVVGSHQNGPWSYKWMPDWFLQSLPNLPHNSSIHSVWLWMVLQVHPKSWTMDIHDNLACIGIIIKGHTNASSIMTFMRHRNWCAHVPGHRWLSFSNNGSYVFC